MSALLCRRSIVGRSFDGSPLKSDDHRDTEIFYETFSANHFLPILRVQLGLLLLHLPLLRITKISEPAIIVDVTSDHFPILAWIDLKPFMINVPTASFYRRTDLAANNLFKQILASTNWDSIETMLLMMLVLLMINLN